MKDDQLDDLKQFITATVSQSEARLRDDISDEIHSVVVDSEKRLRIEVVALRTEMIDGFAGVAEAIEGVLHQAEEHEISVDRWLTKLERQASAA